MRELGEISGHGPMNTFCREDVICGAGKVQFRDYERATWSCFGLLRSVLLTR